MEIEYGWNYIKINVSHSKVQTKSKLYVGVESIVCQDGEDLGESGKLVKVDMKLNTINTMVEIPGLYPSCQYEATFTTWLFSGIY